MKLVAGTHGSDHRDSVGGGKACQGKFGCHGIYGIQDIIHRAALSHLVLHTFKKAFYIIGKHKFLKGNNLCAGTDVSNFVLHDPGLKLPHGTVERNTLPVNVGEGNRIIVHKNQAAHPAPGQGLRCMGPNPSDSEYSHCGVLKLSSPQLPMSISVLENSFIIIETTPVFYLFL